VSDVDVERLRSIKSFPSLVKYLRDELEWPIDSDDFDELTFDYEPEELGLDAKTAVKIKDIKQLRPLASNQPWGIFFVNFEPKRLPVVVLRRILRSLVLKKRQSANKPQQAAWQLHDLLFISAYGESEHRDITLANFSDDSEAGDLPTLKVLGWDDEDTVRHLAYSHDVLKEKLHWPDNPADLANWRHTWSQAFTLKHREVIGTSKEMAERMAELATAIRKRVNNVLAVESDKGPMRKLMTAFREALIHDLKEDDFADMYAQTITYGLLSARVSRPSGLVAENIRDMVPITNPFLRDLLSTFLTVGGRKGKIDFDEVGINDVVQALRDANMEAVIRDFDDKNPQEDPVIHFYELFLKEYDPKKRMQRGVFFTPRPVVSFIVRNVDEILRKDFGLADGLADIATWGEMAKRHPEIKIPNGAKPEDLFVQILDPACGTGTFLVEVIDVIHQTMKAKWRKQGHMALEFQNLWNDYVSDHLLPRLYGFELMMVPYAIAHMKIGLKLFETGYSFRSHERARIYLTNTLEEPKDFSARFEFDAPALAHEAHGVNAVKRTTPFIVVVGNPPYSGISANLEPAIRHIIDPYRCVDGVAIREKGALQFEKNLNDDYVKFFSWSEQTILQSTVGVLSLITNHGYLETPTLRGMRWHLLDSFASCRFLDLHGSTKRPIPSDENVFDIQQGVAIAVLARTASASSRPKSCLRRDLVGSREAKYEFLARASVWDIGWQAITPSTPLFQFLEIDSALQSEYRNFLSLPDLMPVHSSGTETGFDALLVAFTRRELRQQLNEFLDPATSDSDIATTFGIGEGTARKLLRMRSTFRRDYEKNGADHMTTGMYRVFDRRFYYYKRDYFKTNSFHVMQHLIGRKNIALVAFRQQSQNGFQHAFVTRELGDKNAVSLRTREINYYFPLFLFPDASLAIHKGVEPKANFSTIPGAPDADPTSFFHYIYAVLHSPGYRDRYGVLLKSDFPRIPLSNNRKLFLSLVIIGADLVALHLMESPKLEEYITKYAGKGDDEVAAGYPKYSAETVRINPTKGFEGVPGNVWNFHIGGYQVCEKWLKDRRGRVLSEEDIAHYQKIVVALKETIRLMAEIDKVIEAHGGWPGAFTTPTKGAQG